MGQEPIAATSDSNDGLGAMPTLDELSLREYEASEYLKCLGMRNAYGLSPEERIAQTLAYNKAKSALWEARRDLEEAHLMPRLNRHRLAEAGPG